MYRKIQLVVLGVWLFAAARAQTVSNMHILSGAGITFFGGDTVSVWGNITNNGTCTLSPGCALRIYGDSFICTVNTSGTGGVEFVKPRPVPYYGTGGQIFNGIYNTGNLLINNAAGVVFDQNVYVSNLLNLKSGILSADSVVITKATANAVAGHQTNYALSTYANGGYVLGIMKRYLGTAGRYDFPIGDGSNYQLISINNAGLSGTNYLVAHYNGANGGCSLPNPDSLKINGTPVQSLLGPSYWSITPDIEPSSGTYDVYTNLRGYTTYPGSPAQMCVIKRTDCSAAWHSVGVHSNSTQGMAYSTAHAERSGLSSFSQFGIGWGDYALPVTLQNFEGRWSNNDALLQWHTANEMDSKGFEIERSLDGLTFTTIGYQNSKAVNGNSRIALDYAFTDNGIRNQINGDVYYRLKHIDLSGSYSYSALVTLSNQGTGAYKLVVYPSPTMGAKVNVNVQSPTPQSAELHLINMQGQVVLNTTTQLHAGTNTVGLDVSDLPSGAYKVQIFNQNIVLISPLLITR